MVTKKLSIIFIFVSFNLFGQDNPMFDSLDYFLRNKIRNIYFDISTWYYAPSFSSFKITFDKKSLTQNGVSFSFRDTVISKGQGFNDTIKYIYDNKRRLIKKLVTSTTTVSKQNEILNSRPSDRAPYLTTTTYFYSDSSTKRLKKTVTESSSYIEERNFYYDKYLLSVRTSLDSNKIDHKVTFETTTYDYYPDKKLKKETRRVASDRCPDNCEGTIEYKYDTD